MAINFIKTPVEEGVRALSQRLVSEIGQPKSVLWLLSGGSNIKVSVQVMNRLNDELSASLTISLIDERFGPPGHEASNWQQLLEAGFRAKKATLIPVLEGLDQDQTTERYQQNIETAFNQSGCIIGQLGIGADGHIAGILPHSPAAKAEESLVVGYDGGQYQRLTLTFAALRRLNVAYVFAYGSDKRTALTSLKNSSLSLSDQPAQILKEIGEVQIYNDQIE